MKLKQVAGIVFISAATTLTSLWGYNHFNPSGTYFYTQDSAKVPANYAKFFDGGKSAGPADFVDAASAAIPATVHIKTKTVRTAAITFQEKILFLICLELIPMIFLEIVHAQCLKWVPVQELSSVKMDIS